MARRDRQKFDHVVEVGQHLPRLRRRVRIDLRRPDLDRTRVLALAARLLDRGLFRVGGDEYPTFGVATLRTRHVQVAGDEVSFCYAAKGGLERNLTVRDRAVAAAITELARHRGPRQRLLAFHPEADSREWCEIHAADINRYLREASGIDMTAKDLRTWHGTVHAAVALARADEPRSPTAARRTVAQVMREVADNLGNTPTVARSSYVDPRIVEAYLRGEAIETASPRSAEEAVLQLLDE